MFNISISRVLHLSSVRSCEVLKTHESAETHEAKLLFQKPAINIKLWCSQNINVCTLEGTYGHATGVLCLNFSRGFGGRIDVTFLRGGLQHMILHKAIAVLFYFVFFISKKRSLVNLRSVQFQHRATFLHFYYLY